MRCHLDDSTWAAIRDTPGIVNFVGAGGKPSRLSRREIDTFLPVIDATAPEAPKKTRARLGFDIGDTVRVKEGPFADFSGEIIEINVDQLKVKVLVDIFTSSPNVTPDDLARLRSECGDPKDPKTARELASRISALEGK